MFTQKKKSFLKTKKFMAICISALVAFGVWINWDQEPENKNVSIASKVEKTAGKLETAVEKKDKTAEKAEKEDESIKQAKSAYYLVKEIEGVVKIFYYDNEGNESLYMITAIPFDLISNDDQQMLTKGVVIKDEAELESFLENFDS